MSNWVCPYCNRAQTVTVGQRHIETRHVSLKKHKFGRLGFVVGATACANEDCGEVSVRAAIYDGGDAWSSDSDNYQPYKSGAPLEEWNLRPQSEAKPQSAVVPESIREDYYECCLIRNLSPKASATLARRCLQGMIRDFCGISRKRLVDEIRALAEAVEAGKAPVGVTPDAIEAIDAVRAIGNIGAHMGNDINVIVDVDPGEAQALIELLELLFEEWYVARQRRQERLAAVKALAESKKAEIATAKAALLAAPDPKQQDDQP